MSTITNISQSYPLENCPRTSLLVSDVNASLCTGNNTSVLYDDADIEKQCPFAKHKNYCMDVTRSATIFKNLYQHPNIADGTCTSNFISLSDELDLCTPGMSQVLQQEIKNPNKQISMFAQQLNNTCKYTPYGQFIDFQGCNKDN